MSYGFDLMACWLGSRWEFVALGWLGLEGLRRTPGERGGLCLAPLAPWAQGCPEHPFAVLGATASLRRAGSHHPTWAQLLRWWQHQRPRWASPTSSLPTPAAKIQGFSLFFQSAQASFSTD